MFTGVDGDENAWRVFEFVKIPVIYTLLEASPCSLKFLNSVPTLINIP